MFPIVDFNKMNDVLSALEEHSGVFIRDEVNASLGKTTYLSFKEVFVSDVLMPPLDEKTMFPSTIASLPTAKRTVLQKYLSKPFNFHTEPLLSFINLLSWQMNYLCEDILAAAKKRYQWSEQIYTDLFTRDEWVLNIANYPFTDENKGKLLFPAHKDWGLMALYPYIDGEGLEVYTDDWKPLTLPEGCLFFYAGDIFSRVTDGKVKALLHRVSQPDTQKDSRTSVIFYADPVRTMVLPDGKVVGDIIDSKLKKIGQIK